MPRWCAMIPAMQDARDAPASARGAASQFRPRAGGKWVIDMYKLCTRICLFLIFHIHACPRASPESRVRNRRVEDGRSGATCKGVSPPQVPPTRRNAIVGVCLAERALKRTKKVTQCGRLVS